MTYWQHDEATRDLIRLARYHREARRDLRLLYICMALVGLSYIVRVLFGPG